MADLGEADHCNRINALGAMELAGAAAQRGVARFIHLSTANMYAQSDSPRTESDLVFPHQLGTAYFVSKLAGEVYVSNIAERTGMTVLILRIASPYGPGEPMAKVIPTFLRLAAAGKPLRMVNGGVARYNYVHVKDVAIIVAKAVNSGSGGIYNVASGEHISVLELGQLIVALQRDGRADLEVDPAEPDAFLGFAPLSIEKTTRTWHFAPHLITDGLRDYHQYLLQRGEI
ncbi:hypothetical protein A9W95_24435 [Mycobacterium sp. 1423905.2]|nr:hypothetical protein A9W95_24435 [Mycobacterium sp. 1423905.2]